jgi:hypothetical protein
MSYGVGYNMAPPSAFQSETDTRLKRIRENRVIYNGLHDISAVDLLIRNMTERGKDVYYKDPEKNAPIQPDGVLAGELRKAYNYEIALVSADYRQQESELAFGSMSALFNVDATLVPFFTLLNGYVAETKAAMMRNIRPLGIVELTGRDTAAHGATIIAGGVTVALNRTQLPFVTGDLLASIPVNVEEVPFLPAQQGEIANASGRITSILQPVRFLSFYDPEDIREAIWSELVLGPILPGGPVQFQRASDVGKKVKTTIDNNKDRRTNELTRTHAEEEFARSVVALIKFYAHSLRQADFLENAAAGTPAAGATGDKEKAFSEAVFLFLGQTFYQPGTSTAPPTAIQDYCKRFAHTATTASELERRLKDVLNNKAASKALFSKNLIAGTVHALHEHKRAQEQSVMGIVVTGSMPGSHSQMHLCRSSF